MLFGLTTATFEKEGSTRIIALLCMVLVAVVLAVYMQVGNHQFLTYDDDVYVTNNPHVSSGITGNNIVWAFTSVEASNWHPVTWLSHMADTQLYGLNPRGHHLTNVVIHAVSTALLLCLLFRLTGTVWRSLFVAALFALHPLHVESVAWVAERKDVLSAFFWFLTLLLYAGYVTNRKTTGYMTVLFFFVLGLMSKPMLVTLPIVMLILDFWPLNRYRREEEQVGLSQFFGNAPNLIKEKIPFLICSLSSGIVTIYAQHTGGSTASLTALPFILRTENALIAYVKYIIKTLWPHDLAVVYPMSPSYPLWQVIGSFLILLLISVATIRGGRRYPYLPMGWFWFLFTLLPVIGLLQVGVQSMADRYSYIPAIGLFIMAAWGTSDLTRNFQYRKPLLGLLAGIVIGISTALTWHQLGYWRDSISLYRHTLDVTTDNYLIHDNLGIELVEKGDVDIGMQEIREALRINPAFANAHYNMGFALDRKGDLDAAIDEYLIALQLHSNNRKIHNNLGVAFAKKGNLDAAIPVFQEALKINPNDMKARENLETALEQKRIQVEGGKN